MPTMFTMPFRPAYDSNGRFIAGAKAYFTITGTNTPSSVYVSSALVTPLANPIVANASGRFPVTYLNPAITYRVRIYSATGIPGVSTPLEEYDPYVAAEQGTTGATGATGAPGSGGGSGGDIGLFTAAGGVVIGASTNRVETSGRSVVGVYPAAYVRDSDQTQYTAAGTALIAAAANAGLAQTDVLAVLNRIRFQDSLGSYWIIDDTSQDVHAGHFGAVADANYTDSFAFPITGTDSTNAIQALIDWRVYLKANTPSAAKAVIMPPGMFRTTRPLQLGYGEGFRKVAFKGAGMPYVSGTGTTLICDFENGPGIAMQSGRGQTVEDMGLLSAGRSWYVFREMDTYANTAFTTHGLDDRDIVNRHDPAKPQRAALLRYNPNCAVAIDPYNSAAPSAPAAWAINTAIAAGDYRTANSKLYIAKIAGTTHTSGSGPTGTTGKVTDGTVTWAYVAASNVAVAYPANLPPNFLPAAQRITYGKTAASSNIILRRVFMCGFSVGVACKPNFDDNNADFLALQDCHIEGCVVGVSVGNTQSRNVNTTRLLASNFHTLLTNTLHGKQLGTLGGVWTDLSVAAHYQLLDINGTQYSGMTFEGGYSEALQKIGTIRGSTVFGQQLIFRRLNFAFNHDTATGGRGVPAQLLGNPNVTQGADTFSESYCFDGCSFTGFRGVANMSVYSGRFVDCDFKEQNNIVTAFVPADQTVARFYNTLAGGLVTPGIRPGRDQLLRYTLMDETSLANAGPATTRRANRSSTRRTPASIYTPTLSPRDGVCIEEIVNPQRTFDIGWGSFTSVGLSGRTLSFTSSFAAANLREFGIVLGGVIQDKLTGFVFRIATRTGAGPYVFTAQLQNGYDYLTGAIAYETAFTTANNALFAGGGVFTPLLPLFADGSTASGIFSNARQADGTSSGVDATAASIIQTGDFLEFDKSREDYVFASGDAVTATAANSITVFNNMAANFTKKRLPLWVRGT